MKADKRFDQDDIEALREIPTATLTTVLLKSGLRNVWLRGPKPLASGQQRLVGPAFTLRFIPAREDLPPGGPRSTRNAIEEMPPDCVAVAGAIGMEEGGIFGDILCQRMKMRGVSGLVTDGAIRDAQGVSSTGFPVWCSTAAAPPAFARLAFVAWQEPVGCGGVAVFPGDIIVADADGAVVVPPAILKDVLVAAQEQERLEGWIAGEVRAGTPLPGLYPPNDAAIERYKASTGWRERKAGPK